MIVLMLQQATNQLWVLPVPYTSLLQLSRSAGWVHALHSACIAQCIQQQGQAGIDVHAFLLDAWQGFTIFHVYVSCRHL